MWLWHITGHYSSETTEKNLEKPQQEMVSCSRSKLGTSQNSVTLQV
jgi:hypothetical protein